MFSALNLTERKKPNRKDKFQTPILCRLSESLIPLPLHRYNNRQHPHKWWVLQALGTSSFLVVMWHYTSRRFAGWGCHTWALPIGWGCVFMGPRSWWRLPGQRRAIPPGPVDVGVRVPPGREIIQLSITPLSVIHKGRWHTALLINQWSFNVGEDRGNSQVILRHMRLQDLGTWSRPSPVL